jgi:hypothetical protein
VLIANASLFNLRIEMPIYTNESQAEIAKVSDFKAALSKMGLKRFVQDEHFDMIVTRLSNLDCIIEPGLINVQKFMNLLRDLNYDFSGKHL